MGRNSHSFHIPDIGRFLFVLFNKGTTTTKHVKI